MVQFWEVVGGGEKGGIVVREDASTKSTPFDDPLETGSIVEEFEVKCGRMYFRLINGRGPARGWVSLKVKDKALLSKTDSMDAKVVDTADIQAVLEARCARELKKPALHWRRITNDTVAEGHDKVAKGMTYGLEFPWSEETLEQFGAEWLTKAFHTVGSMPRDNRVKRLILKNKTKITTGNNGGKFLFEVEYEKEDPNLHTKLFAKVPHPFEGVTKFDRLSSSVNKQPNEIYEVNAYRLLEATLPMKTPRFYFGDISNDTSNWILITERIDFHDFDGNNFGPPAPTKPPPLPAFKIEGPYDKCIDYNLRGDAKDYYMLLTKVGAKMAGLGKSEKMGSMDLQKKSFGFAADPKNLSSWGMNLGAASGESPKQVDAKLNNALKFWTGPGKAIFPDWVASEKFGKKFKDCMLKVNAYAAELNYWMHKNEDYIALSHMNLNVDNAYFWRDAEGKLDCGVFDWGGLGVASCGNKLWWWYYCMDYPVFKANIRELLACYADTYKEYCGLQLDKEELYQMVLVSAVMQMSGLVSAVPQVLKMCPLKQWDTIKDRYDPRIGENVDGKSTIRLYLHCMNSIMRIIEEMEADDIITTWIYEVYNQKWGQVPKTDAMIGLDQSPAPVGEKDAVPETKADTAVSNMTDTSEMSDVQAMIAARCEKELQRPALQWKRITNDTVAQGHNKMAKGMTYGIDFPWSEETLDKMGAAWLTKAFHTVGSMPKDNKVKRIFLKNKTKITTGNNGGKFLFEVEYEKDDPNLHTKLFAKVPHPFEGVTKFDRLSSSVNKQPNEIYEVNAYRLLEATLPMKTPRFYFGDISNETSNWIIITERIEFHDFDGNNFGPPEPKRPPPLPPFKIEGPYDKCIDYNLRGDAKDYYMLLTKVGAKMGGLAKSEQMGSIQLQIESFGHFGDPKDRTLWGMNPDAPTGENPKQVDAKLNNALKFWTDTGKAIFPDWVATKKFGKKLKDTMLKVNAYQAELNYWMYENEDYIALSHMNLNVDNAYFWRDEEGNLDCGVFDWGGLGVASCGSKLWWWYYCMDYVDFKANIRPMLECYVDTYKEYSGLQLDKDELYEMVIVSAVMQMAGLVSAVPQVFKMCPKKEWDTIKDRYDPRIGENVDGKSTIRLYLHCMNSIMRIIEELEGDKIIEKWIKVVYAGRWGQKPKSDLMIGLGM